MPVQSEDARPADLRMGALLGRGASSRVRLAEHVPTGERLAVKTVCDEVGAARETRNLILSEISAVCDARCEQV